MITRVSILIIVNLLALHAVPAQEINWKHVRNWKLYDIHNQAGMRYPLDTLQHFKSLYLNKDTMQTFCDNIIAWPKEEYSMWMGLYVATCETEDQKVRKIVISTYGGFFYDPEARRYYQVPAEMTKQWLEFLNDSSKRIMVTN